MSYNDVYQIYNASQTATSTAAGIGVWILIAMILAVIGGVLGFFLFTKAKTEPKGKFLQWLKKFLRFDIMWVENILGVVYHILTIFVILFSFSYLSLGGTGILAFFLTLILGPVAVRLMYELIMIFIAIWHNTSKIAENSAKKPVASEAKKK